MIEFLSPTTSVGFIAPKVLMKKNENAVITYDQAYKLKNMRVKDGLLCINAQFRIPDDEVCKPIDFKTMKIDAAPNNISFADMQVLLGQTAMRVCKYITNDKIDINFNLINCDYEEKGEFTKTKVPTQTVGFKVMSMI